METHQRSYFTRRGIAVEPGSRELDLIAGEMHYWRSDVRDWRPCLTAMRTCGVRVVSTYVPWGVHEIRPGRFDWQSEFDLGRFLDLIGELDMRAIIRPGPHINAELTYFGFPERILRTPEALAVTGRDTPAWLPVPPRMFPVPSYASQVFREQVRGWFAAVGEIVAPRLCPDGPIIAVQVDNEAQMFFRLGAYDLDYHPDALRWWREFSGDRPAPRAWSADAAGECARWVHFKDEYTARSLTWLGQALDDAGITGIARYHNLPPSDPSWLDLPRAAGACHLAGLDFYYRSQDYEVTRRRALYLAGTGAPLPFAPEVGMGGPPWLPPMTPEDQRDTLLALLAAGVRGFNLYMMVERERWYGGAIDATGEIHSDYEWLSPVLAALAKVEWSRLWRPAQVALVWSRAEARFALASSAADPLSPAIGEFLGLGPAGAAEVATDESAAQHRRWLVACEQALDVAQIPYDIVDEGVSLEVLAGYHAVIAPTLTRVERALWRRLHQAAERGVQVVIGPRRPARDQYDEPLGEDAAPPVRAGLIRPQSITDTAGFADDLAAIAGDLPDEWSAEESGIDCALFVDGDERPRVLFVGNRTPDAMTAPILAVPDAVLVDAITDESFRTGPDGAFEVPLGGYRVRMLLIE